MAEVYALACPVSGAYRYIGMSTRGARSRLKAHLGPDALAPIRDWVAGLRTQGRLPVLVVIESGLSYREAMALEREWIRTVPDLLNRTRPPRKRIRFKARDNVPNMLEWWKKRTALPTLP
jgi:hypothetical protein